MPATATITKHLPSVAPGAPESASREPDTVEYPEGHWTAQSLWHGDAVRQASVALLSRFRRREDVLVGMELRVYYERGNNKAHLQPDLLVAFGVDRGGNWRSFKVWEEGKAPDFVLEVASPSTAENDARHKAAEYLAIGVREYWRLDPEGSLMGTAPGGLRGERGPVRPGGSRGVRGKGQVAAERGAGAGSGQSEAGRGDGGGLPRPGDGRGVRRRGGGSRAPAADRGGAGG